MNTDMMSDRMSESKVSRLLADAYSQRILSYTYKKPMSAQRLSTLCHIPIAACYRRIHDLEKAGMLFIADEKEIYKGRKVKLYRCSLRQAVLRFSDGKFKVHYDTVMEKPIDPTEGGNGEGFGDNGSSTKDKIEIRREDDPTYCS